MTAIRLVILASIMLLGWYAIAQWSAPSDRVTVCRAMCVAVNIEFWQCHAKGGKLSPIGARRFKVSVPEQNCFEERELGPNKFTKCKVMDPQNWSCVYDDDSGEIGLGKGEFYEIYGEPLKAAMEKCDVCKATGQVPCGGVELLGMLLNKWAP